MANTEHRQAPAHSGGKAPAQSASEQADWRIVDAHLAQYGNPVEVTAALKRIRDPEERAKFDKENEDEAKATQARAKEAEKAESKGKAEQGSEHARAAHR